MEKETEELKFEDPVKFDHCHGIFHKFKKFIAAKSNNEKMQTCNLNFAQKASNILSIKHPPNKHTDNADDFKLKFTLL